MGRGREGNRTDHRVRAVAGRIGVEHDRIPDEGAHLERRGPPVDLLRRAHLGDTPAEHHRDRVRDGQGLGLVVGDEHGGDLLVPQQGADLGAQAGPQPGVESAERLVEQDDGRIGRERPGQRDPLLLTAGQLGRLALTGAGQADQFQQFLHAALPHGLLPHHRPPRRLHEPVADVACDAQVREESALLRDQSHPPGVPAAAP